MPLLAGLALPLARALRPLGTPRGALLVCAHARTGVECDRVEVHALAGGLDIPAAPVVWVVQHLLASGGLPAGLSGLEDVVSPASAITWLHEAGYAVREGASAGAH